MTQKKKISFLTYSGEDLKNRLTEILSENWKKKKKKLYFPDTIFKFFPQVFKV